MPQLPIVTVTRTHSEHILLNSFAAGASGCLFLPLSSDVVTEALRHVKEEGVALCPISSRMLLYRLHTVLGEHNPKSRDLSPQEQKIMRCLFLKMRDKQIAECLHMGSGTVHTHLIRLFRKLGASSRSDAVQRWVVPCPGSVFSRSLES